MCSHSKVIVIKKKRPPLKRYASLLLCDLILDFKLDPIKVYPVLNIFTRFS